MQRKRGKRGKTVPKCRDLEKDRGPRKRKKEGKNQKF
jgi:hypothetical protein